MPVENRYFDPFTVDSMLQGYKMPNATPADKAAAVQTLVQRGLSSNEIAKRLLITERHVKRLGDAEVEPLPPLPDWCDDYERQWPKCEAGHELTPDNYRERYDGRHWRGECILCVRIYKRKYHHTRDQEKHRETKRQWRQRQKEKAS